jgi:hypothetical protein
LKKNNKNKLGEQFKGKRFKTIATEQTERNIEKLETVVE